VRSARSLNAWVQPSLLQQSSPGLAAIQRTVSPRDEHVKEEWSSYCRRRQKLRLPDKARITRFGA
jgi:hypothetical protein